MLLLIALPAARASLHAESPAEPVTANFPQRAIVVDADAADWAGIKPMAVRGVEHLWFGQGMARENWRDNDDLSYQWRGAWSDGKLYFLFEVRDDRVLKPSQPSSYLCDCVEIYLDCRGQGGPRVQILDGRSDWFAKCDPRELMGYELHFLPADPPLVFLDHRHQYATDRPHNDDFASGWRGEVKVRRSDRGYVMEVGFSVRCVTLEPGRMLGIEIGVCDDDESGRKSIMMWTGTQADFWITMDGYGKVRLDSSAEVAPAVHRLGRLTNGAEAVFVQHADAGWGLQVTGAGLASVTQPKPVQLEFYREVDAGPGSEQVSASSWAGGYDTLQVSGTTVLGHANVPLEGHVQLAVDDRWHVDGAVLYLNREVRVNGSAPGGFLSGITLPLDAKLSWPHVQWFAPGMIYGGFENLTDTAIGGRAHYRPGQYTMRIREDRLPAPLVVARFADGHTLAVLHRDPRGDTTAADALDVRGESMIDARFQFGAVGAEERGEQLSLGFWFPGSEGEVTYAGNTYPGGQLHQWRRRHHPLQEGLVQQYQAAFRFGNAVDLQECYRANWRWAWDALNPAVTPHDIDAVRTHIVNVLSACVVEKDGRSGIPNFVDSVSHDLTRADRKAILGFCGKNLEAAYYMLREAALDQTPRGEHLHRQAEAVIASFVRLRVDPPAGEGFQLDDGVPRCAIGDREVFLRSYGDDMKALLKAYLHERQLGREHPTWLAWCRRFGDWLLTQQQTQGGFPRSWQPGSGQVVSTSPNSSYNAVPMLVLLATATGERLYLEAAVRAAEFCWSNGQSEGRFVGGTIDNPDVLDKEAGTLSLEAYLALAEATGEPRWMDRARAAADYAETWIYVWNVPIPADDRNPDLHWKHGVPTAGLQLISTGHSLVDAYMAFDADEFARLYQLTDDPHYLAVARILLHNTKNMVALPDRMYDLGQPGWQQEHWSLAPRRGYGLHRGWLPWVATSQLNGIFGLMDLDAKTCGAVRNPDAP